MTHPVRLALFGALLAAIAGPVPAAKKPAAAPKPEMIPSSQVVRETALKQQPFADAETVATLPANSAVQLVTRQGAWVEVRAAAATGWVRLLSLRSTGQGVASGESGLVQVINVARTGASGNTVATGVRGLSAEQINNAVPNPAEVEKMAGFAADAPAARAFAAEAPLAEAEVPFLQSGDQ